MNHAFLREIELLPFDIIWASGHDKVYKIYTLDEFRRLYNDALETILAYHKVTIHYHQTTETYGKLHADAVSQPED